MPTFQQLIKSSRQFKFIKCKTPALSNSPQKRGICLKVYVTSPKKPNSAKRKVASVLLFGKVRTKIIGYIPGEKHELQEHAIVLIRGGRVKDLPGVRYHLVNGLFDFRSTVKRKRKRSKYGVKK